MVSALNLSSPIPTVLNTPVKIWYVRKKGKILATRVACLVRHQHYPIANLIIASATTSKADIHHASRRLGREIAAGRLANYINYGVPSKFIEGFIQVGDSVSLSCPMPPDDIRKVSIKRELHCIKASFEKLTKLVADKSFAVYTILENGE